MGEYIYIYTHTERLSEIRATRSINMFEIKMVSEHDRSDELTEIQQICIKAIITVYKMNREDILLLEHVIRYGKLQWIDDHPAERSFTPNTMTSLCWYTYTAYCMDCLQLITILPAN